MLQQSRMVGGRIHIHATKIITSLSLSLSLSLAVAASADATSGTFWCWCYVTVPLWPLPDCSHSCFARYQHSSSLLLIALVRRRPVHPLRPCLCASTSDATFMAKTLQVPAGEQRTLILGFRISGLGGVQCKSNQRLSVNSYALIYP